MGVAEQKKSNSGHRTGPFMQSRARQRWGWLCGRDQFLTQVACPATYQTTPKSGAVHCGSERDWYSIERIGSEKKKED